MRVRPPVLGGDPPSGSTTGTDRTVTAGQALVWSFANTIVARFGTLAIGVALARLLGPEEFGTYAVAFVALMAVLSFNELGVSLAIVRWKDEPSAIAPTVTTISIAMSALLTGALCLAAPAFASAMGNPEAAPLVQLLSLCVLVNGVVATPAALLQRLFRQDQRMVADQVNVWVGAFVSLGLAVSGVGALSLVVGRLAGAGLSALLFLHYCPLRYRLGIDRRYLRPLLAFGVPLAGASIVVFLVGFLDQLVVGSRLGAVQLGYYVLAANLALWPVTLFSQPLRSVAPALFSRLQGDPARMRTGFSQVLRPLASIALPACVAISVCSPAIVRFVYGDAWTPAGEVLRWLALLAALRILFELAYDFLVVLGRSRAILLIQVAWLAALVPALVYGCTVGGIAGAAQALLVVSLVLSLPMYLWELRRAGIRAATALRALRLPVVAAGLVAGAGLLVSEAVDGTFPELVLVGLFSLAVCGLLLRRFRGDLVVFRTDGGRT